MWLPHGAAVCNQPFTIPGNVTFNEVHSFGQAANGPKAKKGCRSDSSLQGITSLTTCIARPQAEQPKGRMPDIQIDPAPPRRCLCEEERRSNPGEQADELRNPWNPMTQIFLLRIHPQILMDRFVVPPRDDSPMGGADGTSRVAQNYVFPDSCSLDCNRYANDQGESENCTFIQEFVLPPQKK